MIKGSATWLNTSANRLGGNFGLAYRWIALSNTTLGTLMATINGSIILIALPDIFRGIWVNPLLPGNASLLLLWMILGYLFVTAVLVVTFGRLGDMFGRVRIYTLDFAAFTVFSSIPVGHLAARHGGRAVADRDADLAGCWRGDAARQRGGDPSPTPFLPITAAWRWASTRSPGSPASSSA